MKAKIVNNNNRDEAFLGAIIGLGANLIGGAISNKKKKKAEEAAFAQQQAEQTRLDGVNQAAALSSTYNDQSYVDEFNKKITLKNGGKVKNNKSKFGDRVKQNKKFAVGGRTKSNLGSITTGIGNSFNKANIKGTISDAIGGVSGLGNAIFSNPSSPKQIQKSDGFNYGTPKTGLAANSYQVDVDGNPILSPTNLDNTMGIDTNTNTAFNDRLLRAKLGTKKRINRK